MSVHWEKPNAFTYCSNCKNMKCGTRSYVVTAGCCVEGQAQAAKSAAESAAVSIGVNMVRDALHDRNKYVRATLKVQSGISLSEQETAELMANRL